MLITAAFLLVRLAPGDPVQRMLGGGAVAEDVERVREELGLNDPLHVQYVEYVQSVILLDFGESFQAGRPVLSIIRERTPNTLRLAIASLLIALIISIPGGLAMAALTNNGRHPTLGAVFTTSAGFIAAIPEYVLAMVLVAVVAVSAGVLPIAGAREWSSLVLPSVAIGVPLSGLLIRVVRVETLTALQSDYARTVLSKRLPARVLFVKHMLPATLTGVLTIGGVFFGYLLAGSVIVENVFAWPGLGTALIGAINARDYPLLQTSILVLGMGVLLVNTLVDVLLYTFDPRVREAR